MTRDEAVQWCESQRDEFIRGFDSISEGCRSYDCLIALVTDGTISPEQLPEYGMNLPADACSTHGGQE